MPIPGDVSVETQGAATIDGVVITPTITRSANRVVISAGPLDATIRATDSDGNTIPLGPDGRLRTPPGTNVEITTSGFTIGEPVEIWLFSTPTRLDGLTTNVDGTATGTITIPDNAEVGDHRLVIDGTVRSTNQATITIGIAVPGETSPWRSVPIWIPVTIAIVLALAVPTRWQHQRRRGRR